MLGRHPKDIGQAAQSCRLLREQAAAPSLWSALLGRFFFDAATTTKTALPPMLQFISNMQPEPLLRRYVQPNARDPCPCGTGEQYSKCCQPDLFAAACKPPRRLLRGQLDSWESSGGFNPPKVLNAELPQKPSPLDDDDPTIFRYRAGALDVGNDVFVADLTLKQATDYCGSPLLRASIGFTYQCEEDFPTCAPDPLPPPNPNPNFSTLRSRHSGGLRRNRPNQKLRCYFKWIDRGPAQPHPELPGKWHTFIRSSRCTTQRSANRRCLCLPNESGSDMASWQESA